MRMVIVVLLLVFWLFFAYRAFARGDMAMAGLFLLIGLALTIYRLRRAWPTSVQSRPPNMRLKLAAPAL